MGEASLLPSLFNFLHISASKIMGEDNVGQISKKWFFLFMSLG